MAMLDRGISDCRALIIDSNPTSRSILASQLRDFGVGTVIQCSRVHDARRHLEVRTFDVVLCEQHFGTEYSGQDLLDDLRRSGLLPFSTVFVMVTGEASYARVAEAAESALDSYLLKPHTAVALGERLRQARHRKRVLKDIFEAIEQENFGQAARLCLQRFQQRGELWLYAARIGAELLLRLGKHDAARQMFEAVTQAQALPWAKLGIARSQLEAGQHPQATRMLESLICEQPTYADAYDVMGRAHVEQGNLEAAMATYRQAAELTPASITRLQKQGMLAFYMGQREESAKALERAVLIGISSKLFDFQSLVLLAFARFHAKDAKGLQRCRDNLAHGLEKAPKSRRLQRFVAVADVLGALLARRLAEVVSNMRQLAGEVHEPSFDIEAASNMLALIAQLLAAELRLDDAEPWVDRIALRFCTSKATAELLGHAAGIHPPCAERVRACHGRINSMAERSMSHSIAGDPRSAVRALLEHGEQTMNGKLVDMARLVLQHHGHKIKDAAELSAHVDQLRSRYGLGTAAPTLGQGGPRQAGGLSLRAARAASGEEEDEASTATPGAA